MRVIVRDFREKIILERPGEPVGRLRVELELVSPLDRFSSSQELERSLRSFLSDLVTDLGLPVQVSVQIGAAKGSAAMGGHAYQVWVNGKLCRLPWLLSGTEEELTAEDLARRAAEAVCLNRENCLEPDLPVRIWESWRQPAEGPVPAGSLPEVFHALLSELACRCFSLERARKAPVHTHSGLPAPSLAARYFEERVSGADSLALNVFLDPEWAARLEQGDTLSPADDHPLQEMFSLMLDGLFYELGIALPQPRLFADERLKPGEFRIQVNDLRLPARPGLEPDEFIVNALLEQLEALGLPAQLAVNPANGNEVCRIKESGETLHKVKEAGFSTWGPEGYLVLSVSQVARTYAGCLLNTGLLDYQFKYLGSAFPDLVGAAAGRFDLFMLVGVLRGLLDEEISIRDMRTILDNLLEFSVPTAAEPQEVENPRWQQTLKSALAIRLAALKNAFQSPQNTAALTGPAGVSLVSAGQDRLEVEFLAGIARTALKRYISHKYSRGQNTLVVYLLEPEIEDRLKSRGQLTEDEAGRLRNCLWNELRKLPVGSVQPVILTHLDIRRRVKRLIEKEFPKTAVLAYHELAPDMNIQPLARISL